MCADKLGDRRAVRDPLPPSSDPLEACSMDWTGLDWRREDEGIAVGQRNQAREISSVAGAVIHLAACMHVALHAHARLSLSTAAA